MEEARILRLVIISILLTDILGSESNLRWVEESSSSTCISSLVGDPTEWVQKLIDDPDYEVDIEPYCISSDDGRFGVLKTNPNAPYIMITTDKQSGGLMSFSLMPDGEMRTFFGGALDVTGIAVDYQSQNIYYLDRELGLVIAQFGKSRPYFNILMKNLDNPHELVIDPDEGYLFWAESASIKRVYLNPDSATEILTGLSSDTLLTLDRVEQKVFVLDQEQGSIQSMNYDGSNLKTVISGLKNDPDKTLAGIAAEQGFIFGSVASKQEILIWDYENGDLQVDLVFDDNTSSTLGSIAMFNSTPIQSASQCATDNGGCSHICIHQSESSNVCRCALGYVLQKDGKSCKPEYVTDNFVLVTDVAESGIYQIDIDSNQILGLPVESTSNQRIEAAVYDPVENQVIWIDTGNGTLRSLVLEDGSTEKIIYTFTEDSIVDDITFDKKERFIYYVDSGLSQIGRVSLKGTQNIILQLTEDEVPFQIQLDESGGYIYWTNVGKSPTIERVQMSGKDGRKQIVNKDVSYPSGLALNNRDSLAYWTDSSKENLEQIQFDGNERKTIQTVEGLYSVTVDKDFLYLLRTHDVRRYSLSNKPQSTLGVKIFSLLNDISFYSSTDGSLTTTTTTTTATTTSGDGNSPAPIQTTTTTTSPPPPPTTTKQTTTTTAATTTTTIRTTIKNTSTKTTKKTHSAGKGTTGRTTRMTTTTDDSSILTTEMGLYQDTRNESSMITGMTYSVFLLWGMMWLQDMIG